MGIYCPLAEEGGFVYISPTTGSPPRLARIGRMMGRATRTQSSKACVLSGTHVAGGTFLWTPRYASLEPLTGTVTRARPRSSASTRPTY